MEKKDYYTLKEIILGLNDEYLKYQQKLQELKQFCEMDKKRAIDFNFRIFQPPQEMPTLVCDYDPKQNRLQQLITDISKKTGHFIYGKYLSHLVIDNNQYYFLSNNYPVHIKYGTDTNIEFYNHANSILKSEFSNNMVTPFMIESNLSDINATMLINSTTIDFELYKGNNFNGIPSHRILYNSRKNTLEISSYKNTFDKDFMQMAFDISFPSPKLNKYQIETIEKSKNKEKSIVLEETDSSDMAKFEIQSKETKYVLHKVKI